MDLLMTLLYYQIKDEVYFHQTMKTNLYELCIFLLETIQFKNSFVSNKIISFLDESNQSCLYYQSSLNQRKSLNPCSISLLIPFLTELPSFIFPQYVLIIIFWSKMQKGQETPSKLNSFFQKFNGKVNRVPRLGINALLLKQEFDDIIYPKIDLKKSKMNMNICREESAQLFKIPQTALLMTPQPKIKPAQSEELHKDQLKLLRRHPSERLPLINDFSRQSHAVRLRQKIKSEENGPMNGKTGKDSVGKYRSWKYPRLSEQALRFFVFAAQGGQKSTRN